jgi:hypothetical protein
MVEESEKTLKEKVEALWNQQAKPDKIKKFRIPLRIRTQFFKLRRNFIVVLIIGMNGNCKFTFNKIEDNTVKINGVYYDASADYILKYRGWPLLIIPEWNIRPIKKDGEYVEAPAPFSPQDNLTNAVKIGALSATEKFILATIKLEMIKPKLKFNLGIVLLILALIGGGWWALDYFKII